MVYGIFHGNRYPSRMPVRQFNVINNYQSCCHHSSGSGSFWGGFLGGMLGSLPSLFSGFGNMFGGGMFGMPMMTSMYNPYSYLNQQQGVKPGNTNVDVLTKHYGDDYTFSEVDGKFIATNKETKKTITADSFNEMLEKLQPKPKSGVTATEEVAEEEVAKSEDTQPTPPAEVVTPTPNGEDTPVSLTKDQVQAKYDALTDEQKSKLTAKGFEITDEGIKIGDKVIKFADIKDIDAKLTELAADTIAQPEDSTDTNGAPPAKTWSFETDSGLSWDANFVDVHGNKFEIVNDDKDHLNMSKFKVEPGKSIKVKGKYNPVQIVVQDGQKGFPAKKNDDGTIQVNVRENGQENWIKLEDFLMGDYGARAKQINESNEKE